MGNPAFFNQKFLAARLHLRPEAHLNLFQQIQNTEICYHHHELTALNFAHIQHFVDALLVEIYHNHKRVPLQELYERAMAKAKCRSA